MSDSRFQHICKEDEVVVSEPSSVVEILRMLAAEKESRANSQFLYTEMAGVRRGLGKAFARVVRSMPSDKQVV